MVDPAPDHLALVPAAAPALDPDPAPVETETTAEENHAPDPVPDQIPADGTIPAPDQDPVLIPEVTMERKTDEEK